ncbi:hypothetical protein D1007_22541 [Hordeum vulgare]|nr:hypothetical protein D1007_22541 [Hordeum vulgare]
METAAARRPSGPVLLTQTPNRRSSSPTPVKLDATHSPLPGKSASGPSPSSTRSRQPCTCPSTKTNHPGSSRCGGLHKERKQGSSRPAAPPSTRGQGSKRMNSRQCARRAIKPSPAAQQSQHQRRAGGFLFLPRTSRLSAMSAAGERASDKQRYSYSIGSAVEAGVVFLVWLWRRCFVRGWWNLARGN